MAYNTDLADKVGAYLTRIPDLAIEEKRMFDGSKSYELPLHRDRYLVIKKRL